jgi:pyrimidine-nucleoside phosphorylase
MSFNFLALIEAKRDGQRLRPEALRWFVQACAAGQLPDYQVAAFLMAIYFQGLDPEETRVLTLAMRDSGQVLRFPPDARPLVDKHSTGGVGDKVSLPLAPLLASLGLRVPMLSGRALGITGGTLDKMESIPGLSTALSAERIVAQVQSIGCVIAGPTEQMVPADRYLYALRDVTGTVPSIPLITASILSKKLAEGLDALVLDVKFGSAAFMPTLQQARSLAVAMTDLGRQCGVNTRALLTAMNTPLGRAAGNWLEVKESVACLDGDGPDDLRQLVIEAAAHLLVQTQRAPSLDQARAQATAALDTGAARHRWDQLLAAQGADLEATAQLLARDHIAPVVYELKSQRSGFVTQCDARVIGEVLRDLGAGRLTKEASVDPAVGVDQLLKPGDPVQSAAVLCRIHARTSAEAEAAAARLQTAFELGDAPPTPEPLIVEVI